jgi:hypothetical protein
MTSPIVFDFFGRDLLDAVSSTVPDPALRCAICRIALTRRRHAEGCVLLIGLHTGHDDFALAPRLSGTLHPKL